MPKNSLLIALVLLSAIAQAQKPILFKIKYLPAHTYEMVTKDSMDLKVILIDQSVGAEKKADMTDHPLNMVVTTEWGTNLKADDMIGGRFPVALIGRKFSTKTTLNGTDAPMPPMPPVEGVRVNGKIDAAGTMFLDTATAADEIKNAVSNLTGGMAKQLNFPDQPMKVGDTFSQDENVNAMNMPDFGIDMNYPTKVTYQLIAIKGKMAYFDITSTFSLNVEKEAQGKMVKLIGNGTGTGKMEYFIDKSYPKSIVNATEYMLEITGPNTKGNLKWSISKEGRYVVTKGGD
ncbi:MAG: hypothetical protein EOO43_06320 [Flavobacterium sp.]|nr:MAG: hypothetical protein EOO43_06320 [Flavobacterium sp.]